MCVFIMLFRCDVFITLCRCHVFMLLCRCDVSMLLCRCDALEEAYPLSTHFAESHADLHSWLNDIEAEVNSIHVPQDSSAVGGIDQLKKLHENAKVGTSHLMLIDWVVVLQSSLKYLFSFEIYAVYMYALKLFQILFYMGT